MTNRLVIHLPHSTITIDCDNIDKITLLSNFCKKTLGAFHATESIEELTVSELNEEKSSKLYSFIYELGII